MPDAKLSADFLEEAARYFEKRATGGEDAAHWSNVYNAENCRKAAAVILALVEANARMREANKELRDRLGFWAARQTCEEALADTSPAPWRDCSPEQRLKVIAARKELHDREVLLARLALADQEGRS